MPTQNFDNVLTRVLGILVGLALLTPLLFWPTFYLPFSSPTLLGFLFFVELALPVYLLLVARKQHPFTSLRHPIVLALILLTLTQILTSFTGVDPLNSLLGTLQRPISVIVSIHGLLLTLYVLELFSRDARWKQRLGVLVVGMGTLVAMFALGEGRIWPAFVAYEGRVASVLGNPTFLASFLLIPLFFSLAAAFEQAQKKQIPFLVAGIVMLSAILGTGTRGAILGLIVALVLGLGVWVFHRPMKTRTRKTALLIGASSLVVIFLFLTTSQSTVWQRLLSVQDENVQTRLAYWDMAFEGWQGAPLLGVGSGNFYAVADRLFTPDLYAYTTVWPDKPHNTLLERLVTTGLVGTVVWLVLLGLLYRELWRSHERPASFILLAGLSAYLIQGLFFFDGISDTIVFAFLMAWIIPTSAPTPPKKRLAISILAGAVGIMLAILGILMLVLPLWGEAAQAGRGEIPHTSIVIDDLLVSRTASSLAQSAPGNQQVEQLTQAIALYDVSVTRHPVRQAAWNDQAWLYYLKAVLQSLPVETSGITAAHRAIELAPGRREAPYILELMTQYNETLSTQQGL